MGLRRQAPRTSAPVLGMAAGPPSWEGLAEPGFEA